MRFKLFTILVLFLVVACDNQVIEPTFKSYKAPEDIVDSAYLKLKVKYAGTLEERTFIVKSTYTTYDLFDYTHTINFMDGSRMVIVTTYNLYLSNQFNAKPGNNVSGWQGNYAAMTFTDKYKNNTYDFKTKNNALMVGSSYYKNKFVLLTFNDIYCGEPGYIPTTCSLNGTLALTKY